MAVLDTAIHAAPQHRRVKDMRNGAASMAGTSQAMTVFLRGHLKCDGLG
jgi:hypothetical protein